MSGCISTVLQALMVMGIGTALLAYVCKCETLKCAKWYKAVAYLLIVASALVLIYSALPWQQCKSHGNYDKSAGMMHHESMMGSDGKDCDQCPMSKETIATEKK